MLSQRNIATALEPSGGQSGSAGPAESNAAEPQTTLDPVLVAAREVIMEHGPSRATLAEVARRASVSRMTVYRRFETWDRIVSAVLTVELAQLLRTAEVESAGAPTARARAVRAMVALALAIGDHDFLRRVAEVDPESLIPLLTRRFGQTQRAAVAHLQELLTSGLPSPKGDGSVRDDDPHLMAMTCLLMCQSYALAGPALDAEPNGDAIRAQLAVAVDAYLTPPIGAAPAKSSDPTLGTAPPTPPTEEGDAP